MLICISGVWMFSQVGQFVHLSSFDTFKCCDMACYTRITRRHSGWARDGELPGMCDGLAATDAEWALTYGWHCASAAPASSVRDHHPRCHGYGSSRWRGTIDEIKKETNTRSACNLCVHKLFSSH